VVLPAADPLFGRKRVPLEALEDRSWILFQPGHGLTEVVANACRRAGFQPRSAVRTTQVEAAVRLAVAGLGPTMVPDNVVAPSVVGSVVHLDPPVMRELTGYSRSDWAPLTSAFVEALRESNLTPTPPDDAVVV